MFTAEAVMPLKKEVKEYLTRSHLPASIKDVLENVLFDAQFYSARMDFNFPGTDQPVDWHISKQNRRVYGHVDFDKGHFTLYPGFESLSREEQVRLLVHMGLHLVKGLGISRLSEPAMVELSQLMEKDLNEADPKKRRAIRIEMRDFIERRWAVDRLGVVFSSVFEPTNHNPWPFDKISAKASHGGK